MLRADGKLPQRRDHIPLGILVSPNLQPSQRRIQATYAANFATYLLCFN